MWGVKGRLRLTGKGGPHTPTFARANTKLFGEITNRSSIKRLLHNYYVELVPYVDILHTNLEEKSCIYYNQYLRMHEVGFHQKWNNTQTAYYMYIIQ